MQQIIVYRNPAEAAFWDLMSNGDLIPVFAGTLAAFVVLVILLRRTEKLARRMSGVRGLTHFRGAFQWTPFLVAAGAGVAVARYLWL